MDDIDLPDHSIFDRVDYQRIMEVASTELGHEILVALYERDRLSEDKLLEVINDEGHTDISGTLKDLKRTALIKSRRDPNTSPSDYYTLTDPGMIILEKGVADGVKTLTRRERDAEQKYRRSS